MTAVPAGTFTLGCTPGQQPCAADNIAHTVTLDSFFLGTYEVTQTQYLAVMGNNPAANAACANCPVENVSWYDALRFCNRLSQQIGLAPCYYADADLTVVFDGNSGSVYWNTEANGYRLPTEAEWEYAARSAGADDLSYAGSNTAADVAWLAANSGGSTRPGGQLAPNALGFYDMSGNVAEWVWDHYATFSAGPVCNPLGPVAGSNRVLRGGDYQSDAASARLALRATATPVSANGRTGFRVCSDQAPAITLPDCVSMLTTPANNATAVALTSFIEWTAAANATGYRISLGTSPSGTELINDQNLGNTLRFDYPGCFPQNTTIHVTIVPYNAAGAAMGCAGFSFTTGSGAPDMVLVPGGTINLGGVNPNMLVTIDSFLLGHFEVTKCEWESVMGSWPFYFFPDCGGDCPVENISWYDAATFCNRLSLQQGLEPVYYFDAGFTQVFDSLVSGIMDVDIFWKPGANGYRLPTEAEWEYAARGATNSPNYLYAGSDNVDEVGWYMENSGFTIYPVGQKKPNSLGLNDMSGNIYEWCWDWWGAGSFPVGTLNPTGPVSPIGPVSRVTRGGSWFSWANVVQVAYRDNVAAPGTRNSFFGFRLSRALSKHPACVPTLTTPIPNDTAVALTTILEWPPAANATGYRISLGTSPGGTDLINDQDLGDTLRYDYPGCFPQNTTIHVTITPHNAAGPATGCAGFSFTTGSGAPDMVLVPGGTINLGGDNPTTPVTIDSFWIGRYEVTQCEWESVMGSNPSYFTACGGDCPVEQVNWYDVIVFCNRLSMQKNLVPVYSINGSTDPNDWGPVPTTQNSTWDAVVANWNVNGYRLPTEAEWEYAARGATNSPNYLYAGSDSLDFVGWYLWNSQVNYTPNLSGKGTHPIGEKLPNGLILFDMSGNVSEWCWDWWGNTFPHGQNNPTGPTDSNISARVGRSGGWDFNPSGCRSSARLINGYPYIRNNLTGFRVVRRLSTGSQSTCVSTLLTPTPNDTAVALTTILEWLPASNATGYRISLGTTPGGTDMINDQDLGDTLRFDYPGCFPQNTTIHVTITPYNAAGQATGCAGFSFTTGSGAPDMVLVPGGTINLGGDPPMTPVTIDSFWMGRYEVTQCEWESVMGSNPSYFTGCGGDCPVEVLRWYNCIVYCNMLSIKQNLIPVYSINGSTDPSDWGMVPTGPNNPNWDSVAVNWNASGYRIPTEAEWEYAARGAVNSPIYTYSGGDGLDTVGWYFDNSQVGHSPNWNGLGTNPVGQKKPNNLGLFDLNGNIYEWCWDWYNGTFPFGLDNPTGPVTGTYRVVRGGSWYDLSHICQISHRYAKVPFERDINRGFRIVRNILYTPLIGCIPTLTTPTPNDTAVALTTILEWQPAANATGYRISLGTTPGGTDLINDQDLGDTLRYDYPGCFPQDTTIHVTILPYNTTGPATGCPGFSFTTGSGAPDMVLVPGGTINLGGDNPTTPVTIDSFWMGRYEVTQCEWEGVMGSNPSWLYGCGGDCPTDHVSWYDAVTYCNRLSIEEGLDPAYFFDADFTNVFDSLVGDQFVYVDIYWKSTANGYRLPTEAEWEFAARGATNIPNYTYAGSNYLDSVGWYESNSQAGYTPNWNGLGPHSVGQKQPNLLGTFDMSGNVSEWCWDWWGGPLSFPSGSINPIGPSNGIYRVGRSGSWLDTPFNLRVSQRYSSFPPGRRTTNGGFRFARNFNQSSSLTCIPTLTTPIPNDTAVALTTILEWQPAANATGYRISLGTTPGGIDLINDKDLGDTLRYDYPGCFPQNTTIYVTITPYNAAGPAVGCAGFSFTTGSGAPDMVLVPGGTINLGGDNPTTPVTIDSFWMGRYEVTQCEWEGVMGNWPFFFPGCGDDCPAEKVSWYDAATFCNRLSILHGLEPVYYFDAGYNFVFDSLVGNQNIYIDVHWKRVAKGFRLPTEAEWEFAARGATNNPNYLYSGSDNLDEVGWYSGNNLPSGIKVVGAKLPNSLGIYDMSGNVLEWCWDISGGFFPTGSDNPSGPLIGTSRIHRGGGWSFPILLMKISWRENDPPGIRFSHNGFRLVRTQ